VGRLKEGRRGEKRGRKNWIYVTTKTTWSAVVLIDAILKSLQTQ